MKIEDFFNKKVFFVNLEFKTKNEALKYFSSKLAENGFGTNEKKILSAAKKREEEFSTGIGNEVAVPHIRIPEMKKSVLLFAKVKPMDWESIDNQPIKYIFYIALNDKDNVHIEILSELSKNLMNDSFLKKLDDIISFKELISLFKNTKEETPEVVEKYEGDYDLVGITACPTGIAHTYMAAEQLKKKALEMGVKIKIETQGTEGGRNVLTPNEIKNAGGVLLAIDRAIDLDRFANHPNVIETTTRKVIKNPEMEINNILEKKGAKLKSTISSGNSGDDLTGFNFDKFGTRIFKAMLTGVSYMLPFVIFGGIMIAIAFIIDIPNAGNENFGTVNDVAYWFKTLGGISFNMMVPMLGAYIAWALVGKVGLLPGFITGFISAGAFTFRGEGWFGTPASSSGFFGAIGGGILSAVLIILMMKYIVSKLPKSLNGIMQILVVPFLGTLIIAGLFWIINIPLLYLNWGFTLFLNIFQGNNNLAIILGFIVGIMMASDMGGPINKAAYVFATATLSETPGQGTYVMASVMAAGMVPPLGIAISTALNKKLWTKEEREAGLANWIMGISFITEGAIPFAAKNPKVIIPASMIGASIASMLAAAFGITLAAPHGGIFVFALVKSTLFAEPGLSIGLGITLYLIAIIIGSIITAIMINIFTKLFNKNKGNKNVKIKLGKKSVFYSKKNKKLNINKLNIFENKSTIKDKIKVCFIQ